MNGPYCRCCGTDMEGSDHCPECYCEEFEETCLRSPRLYDRETGKRDMTRGMSRGQSTLPAILASLTVAGLIFLACDQGCRALATLLFGRGW